MSYQVGIDLGTTSTVAAVCRSGGAAQVVPLGGRTGAVASVVYLGADGTFLVGDAAERRALSDPARAVRELTRRIGDATPQLVGRQPVAAAELAARFLAQVVDDVARHESGVASRVAVTHPGDWGPHRVGSLRAALAEHGLGSALLVPEPQAAAAGYAGSTGPGGSGRVEQGADLGVYDLGGGRFDAAVVRRTEAGFALRGAPEGIERFGGADLDEVVFAHVRAALGPAWGELDPADPEVLAAVAELRRECTAAKEALSHDTEVLVPVALPGTRTQVRVGRAEFEEMIRPAVTETVEAMRRAVDAAGTTPAELAALVLVGGSSRIPLVSQLLSEAFGRGVTVAADPLGVVAVGAALLARGDPGTLPVVSGTPVADLAAPGARPMGPDGTGDRAGDQPGGTTVLPVARPPKQARPFVGVAAESTRPRRVALVASAAALALAVLGGVVAFGVSRIGAGTEAGAGTPAPVVDTGPPPGSVAVPPDPPAAREPAPAGAPPATRRGRSATPPTTTTAPPRATTASPPAQDAPGGTPPVTAAPPKQSADPAEDEGAGNEGAGNGSTGGAAADGEAAGNADAAEVPQAVADPQAVANAPVVDGAAKKGDAAGGGPTEAE
jgi:molecular chaperone DnaK